METQGLNHIALSVSDLDRSCEFYEKVFQGQMVVSLDDEESRGKVYAADRLLIGLRQHRGTPSDDRFDYQRVGLDHVAVGVADREAVEAWREHLEANGVEHSGVEETPIGWHLNFKDPDGIALEVFALRPQG